MLAGTTHSVAPKRALSRYSVAVERQPVVVELGRGRDHGRTAVEQLRDHRRGDRALRRAGHHRDLVAVAALARVLRAGGERGRTATRGCCGPRPAPCPATRWPACATTWPAPSNRSESRGQSASISPSSISHSFDQVLAGAGPAVVEQHRLAAVERRRHQTRPVRTEFGGDQVDELGVGGRRRALTGSSSPSCAEHQPGRRGEHAVAAGDLLGELAQRGGVHDAAAAHRRCRRQRHRDTLAGRHRRRPRRR